MARSSKIQNHSMSIKEFLVKNSLRLGNFHLADEGHKGQQFSESKFYTIEYPKFWPSEALFDQTLKIKVSPNVNQIIPWTLPEPSGSFGPPCKIIDANETRYTVVTSI